MSFFQELSRNMTRRYFFSVGSHAVGWAALSSLLGSEANGGGDAGPDALPSEGQAGDLPAHGRRPAADGPVRLQAQDERLVRQGTPRLGPQRPAPHHDDLRPGALPDR